MSLYEDLTKLAAEVPELRSELVPKLRRHALKTWTDKKKTPAGQSYPKSKWDSVPDAQRPFDWSTPAADATGAFPEPWRVSHADRALRWLQSKFPAHKDIYTDYYTQQFHGRLQLWVGLRDNRNADNHSERLLEIGEALRKAKWVVRYIKAGNRPTAILLVDDVPRDGLRGAPKMAAGPEVERTLKQVGAFFGRKYDLTWEFEPRGNSSGDGPAVSIWDSNDEPVYAATLAIGWDEFDNGYSISVQQGRRGLSTSVGALNVSALVREAERLARRSSDLLPR